MTEAEMNEAEGRVARYKKLDKELLLLCEAEAKMRNMSKYEVCIYEDGAGWNTLLGDLPEEIIMEYIRDRKEELETEIGEI